MNEVLTTPATINPVTLDEAKVYCRATHVEEDDQFEAQITAATRYCEDRLGQQFITATWQNNWDCFLYTLRPSRVPLIAVSTLKYLDTAGVQQTLSTAAYQVDAKSKPGRIRPAYSYVWPSIRGGDFNSVELNFTAGYGATADFIPPIAKEAIKYLVNHWFQTREPIVLGTIATKIDLTVESMLAIIAHGGYLR